MKNSYILLRNNVESKSLSFEDLKESGLETSDLIWVECQSVFWQSPTEIAELKPLVFTKKNQFKENTPAKAAANNSNHQELNALNNAESKSIFVEMPTPNKLVEKKTISASDIADQHLNKYGNPDNSNKTSTAKKIFELNSKYSKPQNSIQENTINETVQKPVSTAGITKYSIPAQAKKIALYAGLFAAGAVLMFFIKNKTSKNEVVVQQSNTEPEAVAIQTTILPSDTIDYNTQPAERFEQEDLPTGEFIESTIQQPKVKATVIKNKPIDEMEDRTAEAELTTAKSVSQKPAGNQAKSAKPVLAENIIPKLSINANDYKVGSFGGIRNLEMTLKNDSEYPLDKVTVEIAYLNPEGNMVNAEKIFFKSLKPGEETTIPVQKSKRGVKISYKITTIESNAIAGDNSKQEGSNNYSRN